MNYMKILTKNYKLLKYIINMEKTIFKNIKEIKGDVNLILYNHFNFGLNELRISNDLFKIIEDIVKC